MSEVNLLLSGKAQTAAPTLADGTVNPLSMTTDGRVRSDVTGTVAVSGTLPIVGTVAVSGTPAVTVSGTPAVTVTGTTTATPATGTAYALTATASTNTGTVKASAGSLFELSIFNSSASTIYVKLYNKASAPTLASDVPVLVIPVVAAAFANHSFGHLGKRFGTGIAIAITGAAANTDTTAVSAGPLISGTYL